MLLTALLVLGGIGGYAGSYAIDSRPDSGGVAAPVEATPTIPADVIPEIAPDPDNPPLRRGLELTTDTIGLGMTLTEFPVPKGWQRIQLNSNELKYKAPGYPDNTYILRVEEVGSDNRTIDSILRSTVSDVRSDTVNFTQVARTENSVEYTYISSKDAHFRHAFRIWLDMQGNGTADLEFAITGRAVDAAGMEELIGLVADGARLVNG